MPEYISWKLIDEAYLGLYSRRGHNCATKGEAMKRIRNALMSILRSRKCLCECVECKDRNNCQGCDSNCGLAGA